MMKLTARGALAICFLMSAAFSGNGCVAQMENGGVKTDAVFAAVSGEPIASTTGNFVVSAYTGRTATGGSSLINNANLNIVSDVVIISQKVPGAIPDGTTASLHPSSGMTLDARADVHVYEFVSSRWRLLPTSRNADGAFVFPLKQAGIFALIYDFPDDKDFLSETAVTVKIGETRTFASGVISEADGSPAKRQTFTITTTNAFVVNADTNTLTMGRSPLTLPEKVTTDENGKFSFSLVAGKSGGKADLTFKAEVGYALQSAQVIVSAATTSTNIAAGTSADYPAGTLLKLASSPRIYVIKDGKKKWISTPEVFEQMGCSWSEVKIVTDAQLGALLDFEDNLIREKGDSKVYLVVNGVRRHIPNPRIFLDYGFRWEDVKDTDAAILGRYQAAFLIKESGQDSIYYVNAQGVRKLIPTAEIFAAYNDKREDIQIVSKAEMDSYPLSTLVKLGENTDVYLVEGVTKKRIPSAEVFNRYHFNWGHVVCVNQIEFDFYKDAGELR